MEEAVKSELAATQVAMAAALAILARPALLKTRASAAAEFEMLQQSAQAMARKVKKKNT